MSQCYVGLCHRECDAGGASASRRKDAERQESRQKSQLGQATLRFQFSGAGRIGAHLSRDGHRQSWWVCLLTGADRSSSRYLAACASPMVGGPVVPKPLGSVAFRFVLSWSLAVAERGPRRFRGCRSIFTRIGSILPKSQRCGQMFASACQNMGRVRSKSDHSGAKFVCRDMGGKC